MDSYREHPSEYDLPASEAAPAPDVAIAIGTDERRMHVRAYNYWVSLLEGRDYPSIEDLEPGDVADFAANSVLLDFTCGRDNPATPYIGAAIRRECDLDEDIKSIADVPSRSLLSRLTDHYLQIIANRAPIGFEAEFQNQRGETICYRGILMPFSSDGDTIDFIYGVINWKQAAASALSPIDVPIVEIGAEPEHLADSIDETFEPVATIANEPLAEIEPEPVETIDETYAEVDESQEELAEFAPEAEHSEDSAGPSFGSLVGMVSATAPKPVERKPLELGEVAEPPAHAFGQPFARPVDFSPLPDLSEDIELPELGDDAGLADRLWAARETAEVVKSADGRSRAALYQALALAYDFAIAAQDNPEDYSELLEESGVKAQARAPMTPIVKLVFGIDYDKTRLTEFASALSYACRQQVALGGFGKFIERQPGGVKALVAAERQAKRPEPRPDTALESARQRLRTASVVDFAVLAGDEEFGLIVTRRNADGVHEAVARIDDPAMIDRAIRRAR
ncbi:MAG: hypothetical protein ABIO43_03185 [Sphingomicrobium sp.]